MSSGRWTRARFGAQSILAALLAVVAALFAVEVGDWRFVRVDLSSARKNTLDPAVVDVIDKLPERVTLDVFFQPLAQRYAVVSAQAQQRVLEYLSVVAQARRDRLEVVQHAVADFEATQQRLHELGIEGSNKVVVSCGERKAVLELFGELTLVDWGNPDPEGASYLARQGIAVSPNRLDPRYRPAQFLEFRGEEPFVQALLKVSSARSPRVYVLEGHGEPDPADDGERGLKRFVGTLRADGFEVASWDPVANPEVPAEAEVIVLAGPTQPYLARTLEALARWTTDGGQLLVAPDRRELEGRVENGLAALLEKFGIVLRPGLVCLPVLGFDGLPSEGDPRCTDLVIDEGGLMPGSPLTEPLRMAGRHVRFVGSGAFEAGGLEGQVGVLLPLVQAPRDSWRDLAPYDLRANPAKGEGRERHTLATVKQLPAKKRADGSVQQGRIVALGSALCLGNALFDSNRDFALNAVNWLAAREYRIAVRPLPRGESLLDFQNSAAKPVLTYGLGILLPGLFVLIGFVVFLRRRR